LWPTYKTIRQSIKYNIPYVVSPRGMLVKDLIRKRGWLRKSLWLALIERNNLERSGFVHVTSELESDELKSFHFQLNSIVVIPNGVNVPTNVITCSDRYEKNDQDIILFLGRISWKKGLDRLIRSVPHIDSKYSLVIAGGDDEGYRKYLEKLCRELKVTCRVDFLGEVGEEEKWKLLETAQLVVLPSYQENFGNVVLEAMAASRPVVVTPDVGASNIVRQAGAGVVTSGDPIELANAINQILYDNDLLRMMGSRGKSAVTTIFGWKNIARSMLENYERITSY